MDRVRRQRFLTDARGQYALWTLFVVLIGMLLIGMLVDLGLLLREWRRAQNGLDAAAQAAAQTIDLAVWQQTGQVVLRPEARQVAQTYADRNSFDQGRAWSTVRVTDVQVTPAHTVRVTGVAGLRAPFFLSMFGFGRMTVQVTAVARPAFGAETEIQ